MTLYMLATFSLFFIYNKFLQKALPVYQVNIFVQLGALLLIMEVG